MPDAGHGRPRLTDVRAVRDAMVMARAATPEMVRVLIDVARDRRKRAAGRVKAAEALLNRARYSQWTFSRSGTS